MYPLTLVRLSRNKYITLELKNNSIARGYLVKCDLFMNLHVLNTSIEDSEGNSTFYREIFLRGTSIRSVNIDPSLLLLQKE